VGVSTFVAEVATAIAVVMRLTGQPKTDPMIVRIIEPPSDVSGLGEVLLGALGLTGAIVLAAMLFGVICAVLIYFVHSRQASDGS
jgi:ABC-type Fe3+-siderophore transport system permease subunit